MRFPFSTKAFGLIGLLLPGIVLAEGDWSLCHGRVPTPLLYPQLGVDDGATHMSADRIESLSADIIQLYGDVEVVQPDRQLKANEATYNQTTEEITANGDVEFAGERYSASGASARLDGRTDIGEFTVAEFFLYERHATVTSESVEMAGKDLTIIHQGSYTTCDDEEWRLRSDNIHLMHDRGLGTSTHTWLEVGGVPVFYFPWFMFPITDERMTGMLPPTIGSSDGNGTEVALPIYLNIHPQLDMTITPHSYTRRGLQWQNELRYLTHYGEGERFYERLDDKVYGDERFQIEFEHHGAIGYGWSATVDYAEVSDREYFHDFGNSLAQTSMVHLPQQATLNHNDRIGAFTAEVQDFYTVDDEIPKAARPYRMLPRLEYSLTPVAMGGLKLGLDSELTRFQRDERLSGKRIYAQPSLSLPLERPWGYVAPKLSLHHSEYVLDSFSGSEADRMERDVPIYSVEGGLFFERDLSLFDNAYLQTLEPKLFYLHVPYREQSDIPVFDTGAMGFSSALLYAENRFSGEDRVGDTQQVSYSVGSSLLRQSDFRELLSASVGQIYYLRDRRVGPGSDILDESSRSDMVADLVWRPLDDVTIRGELLWDTYQDATNERSLRFRYTADSYHLINVVYREQGSRAVDPETVNKEIDSSIIWPINYQWSIIGRNYRSITLDRTIEQLVGVEYNSCCWAVRVVRRADFRVDPDAVTAPFGEMRHRWYAELEFKGLTSVGRRIHNLLSEQILGYEAAD